MIQDGYSGSNDHTHILANMRGKGVKKGVLLLFKETFQKSHRMFLPVYHWSDLSHVTVSSC